MKTGIDYIGISVGAMIFNEKGELFLSKRSQGATNERGCWEIPGGKVDFGEALQAAIKREMKEEYGIGLVLLQQLPAQNHILSNEQQHWVTSCFICKIKGNKEPKLLEPEKCEAIGWFSLKKLPRPLSVITKLDLKVIKSLKINLLRLFDLSK